MSSLYSLLKKRRFSSAFAEDSGFIRVRDLSIRNAQPPDCILVNIQSVIADVVYQGDHFDDVDIELAGIKRMVPPYSSMWLEGVEQDSHSVAIQVVRDTLDACVFLIWEGVKGELFGPWGFVMCALNDQGTPSFQSGWLAIKEEEEAYRMFELRLNYWSLVAAHALSRMNCCNVELRAINEPKAPRSHRCSVAPASVWHEIKITSTPKIRHTGCSVFHDDDSQKRAFWVRGHYADYSQGSGLFGNPKLRGLFWIPEHRRGNEELGQVIPEYTIV